MISRVQWLSSSKSSRLLTRILRFNWDPIEFRSNDQSDRSPNMSGQVHATQENSRCLCSATRHPISPIIRCQTRVAQKVPRRPLALQEGAGLPAATRAGGEARQSCPGRRRQPTALALAHRTQTLHLPLEARMHWTPRWHVGAGAALRAGRPLRGGAGQAAVHACGGLRGFHGRIQLPRCAWHSCQYDAG